MNAVSFGPFAFDAERFAAIAGTVVFLAVASILAHRVDDRLGRWSSWTALVGLVAARLGHVLQHLGSFIPEPWRVLAVWQGGFSWSGGVAGVALMLVVLFLKGRKIIGWAAASVVAGVIATAATLALTSSGTQVPPLTSIFRSLTGAETTIGTNGRPTVLNLWATWCPPCRRELPMMAELAASTADVDFVFANQGEPSAKIADYLRSANLKLPQAVLDPQLLLSRHYSAVGLPATLFLAADGTLSGSHLGEISREVLAQKIQELKSEEGIFE
ncbi:TlpA disulfide reductase family protein [Pseudorhizobium flavum]|uniref:Thiol-disulfide isomerase/thioredoxin n=1 Tax=Pseudorhizobium flavum TaxID=1335061 RepID=A0A7W9YVC2_9HYPH|nr:TlpA disulfide reductase family protein [Pseudorhizobium flavum]MBB6178950.1 thiol-disulfide isomerase/thioredoxin [Pseudorhizobium flavum]CAD6606569.1 thiol:disulfide interchange protein [Pseudorhizobium flavum]